ncbi:MAG TPA: RNA polymerase sporulation sigma factor SigH [Armatimonadota bacterium]|nr:RNA polymerase sporulation sigma factor SigH [Armatimonadota bacterium]
MGVPHAGDNRVGRLVDEDLVARAKAGCDTATEHLLRKYRGLVEGKARAFFLAGAERDDVVQEGMIGLFKAIRDFQSGKLAAFRSFAETCVTRQIITATKMASRKKHRALNTSLSLDNPSENGGSELQVPADLALRSGAVDPEQIVMNRAAARELGLRMRLTLSELEQVALRAYLDGRSYHEIADELRMTSKQIDNALQRAKRKIKRRFEPSDMVCWCA